MSSCRSPWPWRGPACSPAAPSRGDPPRTWVRSCPRTERHLSQRVRPRWPGPADEPEVGPSRRAGTGIALTGRLPSVLLQLTFNGDRPNLLHRPCARAAGLSPHPASARRAGGRRPCSRTGDRGRHSRGDLGRRANLVSVYRTVNLLSAIGLLRVLHGGVGRREARYELNEPFSGHHHHLVCQACGRIEDVAGCLIPDDDLARVSRRLLRLRRFRVTEHDLRLLGTCQTCEV